MGPALPDGWLTEDAWCALPERDRAFYEATDESTSVYRPRAMVKLDWRVVPRPWSYGYENGAEEFGGALAKISDDLGFETLEDFSRWLYEHGQRIHGPGTNLDVPPPLLEAFVFPALGWESSMYVIETVAQVFGVSPGTLLDELWLRASRYTADGKSLDDE